MILKVKFLLQLHFGKYISEDLEWPGMSRMATPGKILMAQVVGN